MAKVDTITLHIGGTDYKYNINVRKNGLFRIGLTPAVAKLLKITTPEGNPTNEVTAFTLEEVRRYINSKYSQYLEAEIVEELYIGIECKSCGKFAQNKEGLPLYKGYRNPLELDIVFRGDISAISFSYYIYIKQICSTGAITWYKAKKGEDFNPLTSKAKNNVLDPDTYYTDGEIHGGLKGVVISFSNEALQMCVETSESFRVVSETIFKFISQDIDQLQAAIQVGGIFPTGIQQLKGNKK